MQASRNAVVVLREAEQLHTALDGNPALGHDPGQQAFGLALRQHERERIGAGDAVEGELGELFAVAEQPGPLCRHARRDEAVDAVAQRQELERARP